MIVALKLSVALAFTCFTVLACGGAQPSPETSPGPAATPPSTEPAGSPGDDHATRPELSAEACETSGGTVVGDIGDGAIHKPDYRCASGAPPSGKIVPAAGGPISVEGSVCCPK